MIKPKISIIVPAFNEAKTLGRCLTSLKNQNFPYPYEILVVDNNSTDKTAFVAKTMKIKVIKESIPGPGPARNAGARHAQAEILAFIDADSIAPITWLKNIHKAFQSQPNLVALVGTWQFKKTTRFLKLMSQLAFPTVDLIHKLITGSYTFHGTNFAIKRQVFMAVGGFDPAYFSLEDLELASRVNKVGEIGYLPNIKVTTTDRRFRNKISKFLKYWIPIYISVAILKKPPNKVFPDIRN